MNDERDEHRPPPPSSFPSVITVNVNVTVSGRVTLALDGHAVVEVLSTAGNPATAERIVAATDRLRKSADALKAAETVINPAP